MASRCVCFAAHSCGRVAHSAQVRGDMSNPQIKAGKEGAFKATVEWFLKYL